MAPKTKLQLGNVRRLLNKANGREMLDGMLRRLPATSPRPTMDPGPPLALDRVVASLCYLPLMSPQPIRDREWWQSMQRRILNRRQYPPLPTI